MLKTALFAPGRMDEKRRFFLEASRTAHDQITNLLILNYHLLVGVWQFRETAKHFAHLAGPSEVKNAVLDYISFPSRETAIRRLDFNESVIKVSWERQRDAVAEMVFIVSCSIYESYTGNIEDLISSKGISVINRKIEKGVQFPSRKYDLSLEPPASSPSGFAQTFTDALSYFTISPFMKAHIAPHYPNMGDRNILEDFEEKLQTYLLFKKFRNSLIHGRFDSNIEIQYEVVDRVVTKEGQGLGVKSTLLKDEEGKYFVNFFCVIGFVFLILEMISKLDLLYTLSAFGEADLLTRLGATKDSKQTGSLNKNEEKTRLRSTLSHLGLPKFQVDSQTIDYFVEKFVWRH